MGAALLSAMSMQVANALPLKPGQMETAAKAKGGSARAFNVFGSLELRTKSKRYTRQWNRVLKRVRAETRTYRACDAGNSNCHRKVRAWRKSIKKMSHLKGWKLLAAVNGKMNKLVRYADDAKQFGRQDHWASPIESLTGRGDCEDYVILKYFSLIELGVPEDQMRIVIVRDTVRAIGHAVLAVRQGGKTYILDSLRSRPQLHSSVKRYKPFYSLNRKGSWVNVAARKRRSKVAAVRLPKQTPQQAQALLPDYAKKQPGARAIALRGSITNPNPIQ